MLFESNESLSKALCQQENNGFTPLEVYLSVNSDFSLLPGHEFTALIAMMEIQSKQQAPQTNNASRVGKAITMLAQKHGITLNPESQRLVLAAIYYGISVEDMLR